MKRILFTLFIALIAGIAGAATTAPPNYLMWQFPASGIVLPVYVYQNGAQTAYVPSNSLQYFAGVYAPKATNAEFHLYYQGTGGNWHGCTLTLKKGQVNGSKTTCPGVVINPPVSQNGATSNVYTTAFGATAWPLAKTAPVNPVAHAYANRTITLTNNTKYPFIQVGESCSTSVGSNQAPSCQNTPIVATIAQGTPYVVTVGTFGLNSSAFYLSSFCTAATAVLCGTAPTVAQCVAGTPPAGWVCTGGYFAGQSPYATKIEPTILSVANGIPAGASNVDVSAVDGYSVGVKLYPSPSQYCTYTVPPENSNVLGAGHYGATQPLAAVVPKKSGDLAALCAKSSQLPAGYTGKKMPWNLSKTDGSGNFAGCMSPCAYASANSPADAPQFCCTGSFNTPGTCDVAAGQVGANTSTYNTNIQSSPAFKNVYGFAYGDAGSDYACPPETNFVVEFVSAAGK